MNIKIEFRPLPELLSLDLGSEWHDWPVVASIPGFRQAIIEVPEVNTEAEVVAFVATYPDEIVDGRLAHNDYGILGFPDVGVQANILNVGDTFPLHGINADVLTRGKAGEGVLLAVCDTGVDSRHSAFAGVQVTGAGKDNDGHGHGTHVASTAASLWGVASKARIYAGKALDNDGYGSEAGVANAIRASAEAGAQVISLSLGGSGSQVIDDACTYARGLGSVVVVAAGNSAGAAIGSPARAADIIVMVHDRDRVWAGFTSGRGWSNPNRIGANGVNIQAAQANTANGVASMSGTSMATPHVAGFAALLRAGGHSRNLTISYLLGHGKNPPDGPGSVIVLSDFGSVAPPPTDPPARRWVRFALTLTDNFGVPDYAAGDVDPPP